MKKKFQELFLLPSMSPNKYIILTHTTFLPTKNKKEGDIQFKSQHSEAAPPRIPPSSTTVLSWKHLIVLFLISFFRWREDLYSFIIVCLNSSSNLITFYGDDCGVSQEGRLDNREGLAKGLWQLRHE